MFDLVPPSPGDLVEATRETTRVYAANAGQYAEATETYEDFPGLRDEVLAFAAATAADSPVLDLGSGAGRDSRLLADRGLRVVSGDICLPLLMAAKKQ